MKLIAGYFLHYYMFLLMAGQNLCAWFYVFIKLTISVFKFSFRLPSITPQVDNSE